MAELFVAGVDRVKTNRDTKQIIKTTFLEATDNLAWLKPGETVLLKPALNSADLYPATTDPLALESVTELIEERGGQVVVGDQCGIEHVVHSDRGVIKGNSEDGFVRSGMGQSQKYQFVAFEQQGWNRGFFRFKSVQLKSWPKGFYITNLIKRVDHIVNLPRLSTHIQAGVTLGFKNLVGLLRLDSRLEFHASGLFYTATRVLSTDSGLRTNYAGYYDFWQKITEIYLAIQDKMRVTLISGTQAQLTFGPDKEVIGIFKTKQVKPDQGLIIASSNPVAVEAMAVAFMTYLYKQLSGANKALYQLSLLMQKREQRELGRLSVWENPFVKSGLKLRFGEKDFKINYNHVSDNLKKELESILK